MDHQQARRARRAVLHDVHVTIVQPYEPVTSARTAGHLLWHCAVSCHLVKCLTQQVGAMPNTTASIAGAPPGVLEKCSALVVSATSVRASRFDGWRHVQDARCGAAHATSSTASQGAAATAVGVTPAKAMTSRCMWDWSA